MSITVQIFALCTNAQCDVLIDFGTITVEKQQGVSAWIEGFGPRKITCPKRASTAVYSGKDLKALPLKRDNEKENPPGP